MLIAVLVAIAVFLCLGALAPIFGSSAALRSGPAIAHDLVYLGSAAACLVAGGAALLFLLDNSSLPVGLSLPIGIPWVPVQLRLDPLSAWFLVVVNLAGLAASVYGKGYGLHVDEPGRLLPFFPAFLAGMNLVLIADDAFSFLLAWEVMSVASWLLVLANHRQPGNARAGLIYIVMAVFGGACLLLAFGILAGAEGSYHFADIRAHPPTGWPAAVALFLIILGMGSKAGLVPLHAWLPIAHPAAPSHVSALMSGVMTKVAIYGLVRVLFDLVDPGWGWGALLLALGAGSAFYGILSALFEDDLKTILAWSTIENIGIVVIGLGLALVFRVSGFGALAALSAGAALFHVFNHAVMKSLMFFVAGAVQTATGTRSLERLGGLIHRLPVTAVLALVGAAAIAALPPFNGFVSEWLTFQAVLGSPSLTQWTLRFGVPAVGAVMALAAALAASCFVRLYGIAFLGRPRSPEAAAACEVDRWMRRAMAGLAALCLVVGVLPMTVVRPLGRVVAGLVGTPLPAASNAGLGAWLWLTPLQLSQSSYSGLVVLLAAVIVTIAVAAGVHRLGSNRVRLAPPWDCGFPDPRPATQYTASSFAQPLRRVFGGLIFRAAERVDMPEPGETRPARLDIRLVDPLWSGLYAPLIFAVGWLADRANPLQYLTIRRYLSLMFVALIALLSAVALLR